MHVLLIHQAFVTPDQPGSTRHYGLARHLIRRGAEITVVASRISYLTGRPAPPARSGVDGLRIRVAWTSPGLHRGMLPRIVAFVTFMASAFGIALTTRGVDVIWVTSPPLPQCIAARLAARVRRIPYVMEVRDLWPDAATAMDVVRSGTLIRVADRLVGWLYRGAARMVVNSPGFVDHLVRHGVKPDLIDLVPNGVEPADFDVPGEDAAGMRRELGLEGNFVALYAGAHGPANGLDGLLDAAGELRGDESVRLVLVGDGADKSRLQERARALALTNVIFLDPVSKEDIPSLLAAADVCVGMVKPLPEFKMGYPNKMVDYMASGRPVVCAMDGAIAETIAEARAGVVVDGRDPAAIADAIRRYCSDRALAAEHGRNARAHVISHFARSAQAPVLEETFNKAIHQAATKRHS